ncbi:MAG: transposase [Chroococcidiopsis sp.]
MLGKKTDEATKIKALAKIFEGKSLRTIAKELGISKSLVGAWKKEYEQTNQVDLNKTKTNKIAEEVTALQQAENKGVKVSDRYSEYVDTLRTAKDRQGKWAGAITETGIRTLKFANKFLAKVEKKENLSKQDMELVRLIPTLLNSSASAIKSASEAEDRAYSLELLIEKLNELPQQIQNSSRNSDLRAVAPND